MILLGFHFTKKKSLMSIMLPDHIAAEPCAFLRPLYLFKFCIYHFEAMLPYMIILFYATLFFHSSALVCKKLSEVY